MFPARTWNRGLQLIGGILHRFPDCPMKTWRYFKDLLAGQFGHPEHAGPRHSRLRPPGWLRRGAPRQRHSLMGAGFVKLDAWIAWIRAAALASKYPVNHLEPARGLPLWPWAARLARLATSCSTTRLGARDSWRLMRGVASYIPHFNFLNQIIFLLSIYVNNFLFKIKYN